MQKTITIAPRFNGPANSGNGGYVCGLLAREIGGPSEAVLRAPPPLGASLTLAREDSRVTLMHGAALIGEAHPAAFDLQAPPAPTFDEARAAEARYVGHVNHRYPTCFVCGGGRDKHDGLALFTGRVTGRDMVAASWTPSADLADDDGLLAPEFIHAALDCPTYWALPRAGDMAALLARLTASIDGPRPRVGEALIVAAWPLGSDGRKHRGAGALYTAGGAVIARAEALWIEPRS